MQKILLGLFLVCAMNDKILASEHDPYGRLVTKTTVRLMKKHKIPGVAIAIIDNNKSLALCRFPLLPSAMASQYVLEKSPSDANSFERTEFLK